MTDEEGHAQLQVIIGRLKQLIEEEENSYQTSDQYVLLNYCGLLAMVIRLEELFAEGAKGND